MFSLLLSWMFPPHCLLCQKPLSTEDIPYLCRRELSQLKKNTFHRCPICALPQSLDQVSCKDCVGIEWFFKKIETLYLYEEPFSSLLIEFKYSKKRFLIRMFEELLKNELEEIKETYHSYDYLTFVPMFAEKEKERGFNQAQLIAEVVAKECKIPIKKKLIKRLKPTLKTLSPQAKLNRKKRQQQLINAFGRGAEAKVISDRKVLLIDDVVTTGSTVNECAKKLKELGAKEVVVFALARTGLNK